MKKKEDNIFSKSHKILIFYLSQFFCDNSASSKLFPSFLSKQKKYK